MEAPAEDLELALGQGGAPEGAVYPRVLTFPRCGHMEKIAVRHGLPHDGVPGGSIPERWESVI